MENILRLKVEGTQYNNTIKSAAEGIQHLAQYMRNLVFVSPMFTRLCFLWITCLQFWSTF